MRSKGNAVKKEEHEWEFDEIEPMDQEIQDRTLVLRKEPLPRKVQLLAAGAKEIRCVCCARIRPLSGAEELGERWICGDCLSETSEDLRWGGQGGK